MSKGLFRGALTFRRGGVWEQYRRVSARGRRTRLRYRVPLRAVLAKRSPIYTQVAAHGGEFLEVETAVVRELLGLAAGRA